MSGTNQPQNTSNPGTDNLRNTLPKSLASAFSAGSGGFNRTQTASPHTDTSSGPAPLTNQSKPQAEIAGALGKPAQTSQASQPPATYNQSAFPSAQVYSSQYSMYSQFANPPYYSGYDYTYPNQYAYTSSSNYYGGGRGYDSRNDYQGGQRRYNNQSGYNQGGYNQGGYNQGYNQGGYRGQGGNTFAPSPASTGDNAKDFKSAIGKGTAAQPAAAPVEIKADSTTPLSSSAVIPPSLSSSTPVTTTTPATQAKGLSLKTGPGVGGGGLASKIKGIKDVSSPSTEKKGSLLAMFIGKKEEPAPVVVEEPVVEEPPKSFSYTIDFMKEFLKNSKDPLKEEHAFMNRKIEARVVLIGGRSNKKENNNLSKSAVPKSSGGPKYTSNNPQTNLESSVNFTRNSNNPSAAAPPQAQSLSSSTSYVRAYVSEEVRKKKEELQRATENLKKREERVKTDEEIMKESIRENLNKLTPDNINIIKTDLMKVIENGGMDGLTHMITITVEKAWQDKLYSDTYASLCKYIDDILNSKNRIDEKKHFKNTLCENLESIITEKDHDKIYELHGKLSGITEKAQFVKKYKLGIIYFTSSLIGKKLINNTVVSLIIQIIIKNFLRHYFLKSVTAYELEIEGLIHLFDYVAGSQRAKNNKGADFTNMIKKYVQQALENQTKDFSDEIELKFKEHNSKKDYLIPEDSAFGFLEMVKEKVKPLSTRIVLLIENLFERRENGWKESLTQIKKAGTIEEIRREFELEQEKAEMNARESRQNERYGKSNRDNRKYNDPLPVAGSKKSSTIYVKYEAKEESKDVDSKDYDDLFSRKGGKTKLPEIQSSGAQKARMAKLLQAYFEMTKRVTDQHPESLEDYLRRIRSENQVADKDYLLAYLEEFYQNGYREVVETRADMVATFFLKERAIKTSELQPAFFASFLKSYHEGSEEISKRFELLAKVLSMFNQADCKYEEAVFTPPGIENNEDDLEEWTFFFKDLLKAASKFDSVTQEKVTRLAHNNKCMI